MTEIRETLLPGVGVRHVLATAGGERLALLTHRTERRELAIYDRNDPDVWHTVLHLNSDATAALGELLGTSQISETVRGVQQLEGVATDWMTVGRAPQLRTAPWFAAAPATIASPKGSTPE